MGIPFAKGFTIVEVLLALALIGLVGGLFAINFDVLLSSISKKRPERVLYEAICEARYQTIQEHSPVYLSFDKPKSSFLIFKNNPAEPLTSFNLEKGINIVFGRILPNKYRSGRFAPQGLSPEEVIEKIAFFPDGSSDPVVITLSQDNFSLKFKPDLLSSGMSTL